MRAVNVLVNLCHVVSKMGDIQIFSSRSSKVKCEDRLELTVYGFLFAPNTVRALISDRLATGHGLSLCPKMNDLEIFGSRLSKVISEDRFGLQAYGFLFTPHTICDRLATIPLCHIRMYLRTHNADNTYR